MSCELSSLDIFFLTKELQKIKNGRIESFYVNREEELFYIKFYNESLKNQFLKIKLSQYCFFTKDKLQVDEPTGFTLNIRKKLKGAFICEIEQIPRERIIKITLSKKKDEEIIIFHIYIEIFQKGNIILTNGEDLIIDTLIKKTYQHRILRAKNQYILPPKIEKNSINLIGLLCTKYSLGKKFAKEIIFRLKKDEQLLTKDLTEKDFKQIDIEIEKLKSQEISAYTYRDNFYPITFQSLKDDEKQVFIDFNTCLEKYFQNTNIILNKKEKEFNQNIEKLNSILQKQILQKQEVKIKYEEFLKIGNTIYENYSQIETLLTQIKQKKDNTTGIKILKKDEKNNTVEIEI